jgi:ABC-type multidrug transport system fused ATPase/permease subunit
MHADRIVVLTRGEDGFAQVAEEGNHNELVERNGVYAQLWRKHIGAVSHQEKSIEVLFDGYEQ